MPPRLVIDDAGRIHHAGSLLWRKALGTNLPEHELVPYAVRNIGFVAAETTSQAVRVWLRPKIVSPIAFATAIQWLTAMDVGRCCLTIFDDGWHDVLYGDVGAAIQALVDHALDAERPREFYREQLPLSALSARSPLAALLARVTELGFVLDRERLRPILHMLLADRYVLVEPRPQDMIIVERGVGMPMLASGASPQPVGSRLKDLYDYRFGRWGSQAYEVVAREQCKRLDKIDVTVNLPTRRDTRVRYTRIIIPLRTSDGSSVLLGTSILDATLGGLIEPAQKA
jgi:hypothetical protein